MCKNHELKGPVLLLAGPGTGKTYTLGLRLQYLINEKNVTTEDLNVITFTSGAAKNMRSRISDQDKKALYLPYNKQPKNIITMHSLGFKIIKAYSEKLGYTSSINLIPGDLEKKILLEDAAQLYKSQRVAGKQVSGCRQIGNCQKNDSDKCEICEIYMKILKKCSAIDYDAQILLAVELLENNQDILAEFQLKTRHLLVDEYQDINLAQHKLIKLLCKGQENGLFVVGDDDQSIYSWRGGSPKFIRNFTDDFGSEARVIPLNISYRCHKNILEGSLNVVQNFDGNRLGKTAFEYNLPEGPKIKLHNVPSDKKEARIVRQLVQSVLPSQDVLILVPQKTFTTCITRELRSHQIGFSIYANVPGLGLPLISRLSDWLNNPNDSIAFRRCLESYINRKDSPIPSKLARKAEKIKQREDAFLEVSNLWNDVIEGRENSLWKSLEIHQKENPFLESIWGAFNALLSQYGENTGIADFLKSVSLNMSPWKTPKTFLEEVGLWIDSIRDKAIGGSESSVRIMTFQAAKGLEAKVVCVIGLEDGIIPKDDSDVAEQSRLLFVSMTRAINELHLFHARIRSGGVIFRNPFKEGKPDIKVSRFIASIPRDHIETKYHPN